MRRLSSNTNSDIHSNQYMSLVDAYIKLRESKNIETFIIGIQGPPGIGKTTLSTQISSILRNFGYRVETVSIDDFYSSLEERKFLSQKYNKNPLYQISRGMPGTHRISYLKKILSKVKKGESVCFPIFDKALEMSSGDIATAERKVEGRLDFLILEGWCVAMPFAAPRHLFEIFEKDPYVLKILDELNLREEHFETVMEYLKRYQRIWDFLDTTTSLQAQDLRYIEDWKIDQESKLFKSKEEQFNPLKIERFAKYFIPLSFYLSECHTFESEKVQKLIIGKGHLIQN